MRFGSFIPPPAEYGAEGSRFSLRLYRSCGATGSLGVLFARQCGSSSSWDILGELCGEEDSRFPRRCPEAGVSVKGSTGRDWTWTAGKTQSFVLLSLSSGGALYSGSFRLTLSSEVPFVYCTLLGMLYTFRIRVLPVAWGESLAVSFFMVASNTL